MSYLMENEEEGVRLWLKTNPDIVKRQATWAGLKPGMRVLDVGCGTGITTAALAEIVGPEGSVTGLDFSKERLAEAKQTYGSDQINFVCHDITKPFIDPLPYDFVWIRFLLEYFRDGQEEIAKNALESLKVGGIACLADADNNNLSHYGPKYNQRVENTIKDIICRLSTDFNFDPYAGRRLYSHLYNLGFENLTCMMEPHHLVYNEIPENDMYNWLRKLEVTAVKSGCQFDEYASDEFAHYPNRYEAFMDEFRAHIKHPARFTFTPIIICRGVRKLRAVT